MEIILDINRLINHSASENTSFSSTSISSPELERAYQSARGNWRNRLWSLPHPFVQSTKSDVHSYSDGLDDELPSANTRVRNSWNSFIPRADSFEITNDEIRASEAVRDLLSPDGPMLLFARRLRSSGPIFRFPLSLLSVSMFYTFNLLPLPKVCPLLL